MSQLETINNQQILQELKERINRQQISKEQVFIFLENSPTEIINEYEKTTDLNQLTKTDWEKACQILEKDKNYQESIKLWDSIDE